MTLPSTYLQMISTVSPEGELTMELAEKPMPELGEDEVLIRVEATPINPSDQGVMFGWASMGQASSSGTRWRDEWCDCAKPHERRWGWMP